jgi:hypothetical protein
MTAAASGAARARSRAPQPRQLNWEMIAALTALVVQLGAAVWFASAADRRISNLEAELPPGFIQRLDERTLQMQTTLNDLKARR